MRERFYFKVPHFFVGTLQPPKADWKGRPQWVYHLSASVQFPLLGLPQGNIPRSPYERPGVGPPTSRTNLRWALSGPMPLPWQGGLGILDSGCTSRWSLTVKSTVQGLGLGFTLPT